MLPVAAGANGQPPRPPIDASNIGRALLEADQRVGVTGVARVVQVQPDRPSAHARTASGTQPAHLGGHADADRVGEHHLVGAGAGHPPGVLDHDPRVDRPLERTAERGAERRRRRAARRVAGSDHRLRRRSPPARPSCPGCAARTCRSADRRGGSRRRPPAIARSTPRWLSASAAKPTPLAPGSAAITSSAPAICGHPRRVDEAGRLDPRQPASASRLHSSRADRRRQRRGSFCSPSRGPTSHSATSHQDAPSSRSAATSSALQPELAAAPSSLSAPTVQRAGGAHDRGCRSASGRPRAGHLPWTSSS